MDVTVDAAAASFTCATTQRQRALSGAKPSRGGRESGRRRESCKGEASWRSPFFVLLLGFDPRALLLRSAARLRGEIAPA